MAFSYDMNRNVIEHAYERGVTVSAHLETLDPTSQYPLHEQHMDAFQRQLARYDIRTASDPINGIPAHFAGRFFEDDKLGKKENRAALFPEWLARQYRAATRVIPRNGYAAGNWSNNAKTFTQESMRFPQQDVALNFTQFPPSVLNELRFQMLQPSALNRLIARERMITGDTFTALYLNDTQAQAAAHLHRVEEYAEMPSVRFDTSELSIKVKKYGRKLQISYEALRRTTLDMVTWAINYIAAVANNDKESTAIDILINGDGNSGTSATSTNGSTLDAGAGGVMTLKMWIAWRFLWSDPYAANIVVGRDAALTSLLMLNAGSANLPSAEGVPNMASTNRVTLIRGTQDGVAALDNDTVPANQLLGIDSNWTLELVREVGADMVETDKIIGAQFHDIAISEVLGFAIATKGQNRILAFTA